MVLIVVMGVSGCGKSTIGALIARKLGCEFQDADAVHSKENKSKMAQGIALTDEDRLPWLLSLHAILKRWSNEGTSGVLACSALKKSYRNILRSGNCDTSETENELLFVFLLGRREVLAKRLADRQSHFMPSSLLESQLAALEIPDSTENYMALDITFSAEELSNEVINHLQMMN